MKKINQTIVIAFVVAVSLAAAVSYAGSQGGVKAHLLGNQVPVFLLCAALAFVINWLAFIPAYFYKTEHYYDLTGSLTYLSVIALAVCLSANTSTRATLVAAMVVIWAVRLGSFLFRRIKRDGKDDRFDVIKAHTLRFFLAWTLQGLWVVLTASCALAIITGGVDKPIGLLGGLGMLLWLCGFIIEIVADRQKTAFKQNPSNQDKFIREGIWAWSRHPNYFGEIMLWSGIALFALPVLSGWQLVCLISPLFVFVLIRYISGVNKLEEKAESKWGNDPMYRTYKKNTPLLGLKRPAK